MRSPGSFYEVQKKGGSPIGPRPPHFFSFSLSCVSKGTRKLERICLRCGLFRCRLLKCHHNLWRSQGTLSSLRKGNHKWHDSMSRKTFSYIVSSVLLFRVWYYERESSNIWANKGEILFFVCFYKSPGKEFSKDKQLTKLCKLSLSYKDFNERHNHGCSGTGILWVWLYLF